MNPWPLVLETTVLPTELFSLKNLKMFSKYFYEIRNRVSLTILCWSLCAMSSYLNKETLLYLLIQPCEFLFKEKTLYFIATNLTDIFSVYLALSYFVAFQLTFAVGVYHIKTFLTPGLYRKELKYLNLTSLMCFFFWSLSFDLIDLVCWLWCFKCCRNVTMRQHCSDTNQAANSLFLQ